MNRALVLIGCLAAAGAVAAYSKQAEAPAEQPQVFTVAGPAASGGLPPAPVPAARASFTTPADRVSLIRELQRELKRVGCYSGEINGVWTTSSRMAMKSFTDAANASLPIDNPDDVLLSLVRGHHEPACAASCSSGQALNEKGRCAVTAGTPLEPAPSRGETASEPSPPSLSSAAVPASAAAGAAVLAGSAVIGKDRLETAAPERSRTRVVPEDNASEPKRRNRHADHGRPVPRERVYKRQSRRYSNNPRPPKFVRNVLRAFGIQ